MAAIRTILHPTDFSESAEHAFRIACALARDYDANLIVVHVMAPPVMIGGATVVPEFNSALERDLRARLYGIRPDDAGVRVGYRMAEGDPASAILNVARESRSDLIVMGTHGRGWVGRLLMGSVAQEVVRKSACPVLTVKTPWAAKEAAASTAPAAEPAAVGP
jgi:nucleotide-binding universal stress UspA family protein